MTTQRATAAEAVHFLGNHIRSGTAKDILIVADSPLTILESLVAATGDLTPFVKIGLAAEWSNGATARALGSGRPDQLRGLTADTAWACLPNSPPSVVREVLAGLKAATREGHCLILETLPDQPLEEPEGLLEGLAIAASPALQFLDALIDGRAAIEVTPVHEDQRLSHGFLIRLVPDQVQF